MPVVKPNGKLNPAMLKQLSSGSLLGECVSQRRGMGGLSGRFACMIYS